METDSEGEKLTQALRSVSQGDRRALDQILSGVYDELRAIARRQMAQERVDHTLQPTALVHEVYARFVSQYNLDLTDPRQLLAAASKTIRRILVDHARAKGSDKRGGKAERVELDIAEPSVKGKPINVLDLEEALERLQALNPRAATIVEMRFFGGFQMTEVADALNVSLSTANNDWAIAKAWLMKEISR